MEAFIVFISGLVGAVLGAWCAVLIPSFASRRQTTLGLMERYTSPEFFIVRAETWKIRYAWEKGDRSCVQFFVKSGMTNIPEKSKKSANGLTPHQNLSWLLHFFSTLYLYQKAGLVNSSLLKKLFEPQYAWYKEFFHEFLSEYRKRASRDAKPEPIWISAIPGLEKIFERQS